MAYYEEAKKKRNRVLIGAGIGLLIGLIYIFWINTGSYEWYFNHFTIVNPLLRDALPLLVLDLIVGLVVGKGLKEKITLFFACLGCSVIMVLLPVMFSLRFAV